MLVVLQLGSTYEKLHLYEQQQVPEVSAGYRVWHRAYNTLYCCRWAEFDPMKVVLELQDQPSNVRRITIRHDIVIGRGSDCNLRLSAPQVSRRHCFLRVGRDSVSVTDLDSSNGTFVDGKRIVAGKRCDITDGVQLALGPIRFIVHVRTEVAVTDATKLKSKTGIANEFLGTDSGQFSRPRQEFNDDSSTVDGRSLAANSKHLMDYAVEQGGSSAEPHAATDEDLEKQYSVSGSAEIFSPDLNPMDSRLEIIDFGRRLSEESQVADGSSVVPDPGSSALFDNVDEGEPRWASAVADSSESHEDIDILSIADDSSVHRNSDDVAGLSLRKPGGRTPGGQTHNTQEIIETAEFFKVVEDLDAVHGRPHWFAEPETDAVGHSPDLNPELGGKTADDPGGPGKLPDNTGLSPEL